MYRRNEATAIVLDFREFEELCDRPAGYVLFVLGRQLYGDSLTVGDSVQHQSRPNFVPLLSRHCTRAELSHEQVRFCLPNIAAIENSPVQPYSHYDLSLATWNLSFSIYGESHHQPKQQRRIDAMQMSEQ